MSTHRYLPYVLSLAALGTAVPAALGACATNDEGSLGPKGATVVPEAQAPDASGDGAADAGPCTDCEYFPEACSADVLCANGPFGAVAGFDSRTHVNAIQGRSPSDVWVAGALGAIAHFDGASWNASELGARQSVHAVWLRESTEISAVTLADLYSRGAAALDAGSPSAGGWIGPSKPQYAAEFDQWKRSLKSGWSVPGAQWAWGATENICNSTPCSINIKLKTSGVWRVRSTPSGGFELQSAIPSSLCQQIGCTDMSAVHGTSANDLWAVGSRGAALHITDADSDTPTVKPFNSQTWDALYGVWAASPTDAWAVGAKGIVRRYTGDPVVWDVVSDVNAPNDLRAVSGSSPSDVWAVGDGATVFHYDGKTWSRVKIAGLGTRRPDLGAVWVASPGHVWIGGQGVLLSLGGKP